MFNADRKYIGVKHDLLVCACSDPHHQIVFTQYEGDPLDKAEVFMYVHLRKFSFWKRLQIGIQYIFGRQSQCGAFDDIMLTTKEMDQLGKIVEDFKKGLSE
jgi:hypothetical protein